VESIAMYKEAVQKRCNVLREYSTDSSSTSSSYPPSMDAKDAKVAAQMERVTMSESDRIELETGVAAAAERRKHRSEKTDDPIAKAASLQANVKRRQMQAYDESTVEDAAKDASRILSVIYDGKFFSKTMTVLQELAHKKAMPWCHLDQTMAYSTSGYNGAHGFDGVSGLDGTPGGCTGGSGQDGTNGDAGTSATPCNITLMTMPGQNLVVVAPEQTPVQFLRLGDPDSAIDLLARGGQGGGGGRGGNGGSGSNGTNGLDATSKSCGTSGSSGGNGGNGGSGGNGGNSGYVRFMLH
jgi:hypothetical protein